MNGLGPQRLAQMEDPVTVTCMLPPRWAARLQAEPAPIGTGRDPCVSFEELPEEGEISISDGITDLLHAAMVVFQHSLGGSHAKFLQVDQRSISGGLLKATDEIS